MVLLGQWPFQHSMTHDRENKVRSKPIYYYVDNDQIIDSNLVAKLPPSEYVIDNTYWIVVSRDIYNNYIEQYMEQILPPIIPEHLNALMLKNTNKEYLKHINAVKDHAALAIIGKNNTTLLEELGAIWNNQLGVWILNPAVLKDSGLMIAGDSKKDISIDITCDGMVQVSGNINPYVSYLTELGGTYNDKEKAFYLPIDKYDEVSQLLEK